MKGNINAYIFEKDDDRGGEVEKWDYYIYLLYVIIWLFLPNKSKQHHGLSKVNYDSKKNMFENIHLIEKDKEPKDDPYEHKFEVKIIIIFEKVISPKWIYENEFC